MDEATFSTFFDNRKGPFHLSVDSHSVVRRETRKRVFESFVDYENKIVLHDEADQRESSVFKIAFPARDWLSRRTEPETCGCGETRCKGWVTVQLHNSNPTPHWTLELEGML
jgi:hypothetical protein